MFYKKTQQFPIEIHSCHLSEFFATGKRLYYFSLVNKRVKNKSWHCLWGVFILSRGALSLKRAKVPEHALNILVKSLKKTMVVQA